MKAPGLAILFAALSFAAVLAATTAVSHFAGALNGMTLVPGFAEIRIMFNRGVSFGLLAQDSDLGENLLALGTAVLTAALCAWAYWTQSPRLAIAQGIMIGGALYNTADRVLHLGVFDFLFLRLGTIPLFVCNAADIVIGIGVVLMLFDMVREARQGATA